MNVFAINVRFDNPTEIKALMKANDAQHMKELLMKIFDEVKNLEIVNIDDLGPIDAFDHDAYQASLEEDKELASMIPANKGFVI
jgi:hypothetical protein